MDIISSDSISRANVMGFVTSIYSLVLVIVLWEIIGQFGLVYYYFLPPISDIFLELYELTASGVMVHHAYLTVRRAVIGLVIACTLGVLVGVLAARVRVMAWFWNPIIEIGYPVPIIALIPVFLFWFGSGDFSKIVLVIIGCFWPVAINARNATRDIDKNLIWSARMMGTSDRELIRKVVLPAAAPGIISGIQIALPLSLIITFVFEMTAGGGGLGFLEISGVRDFNSAQTYATLIVMMVIGFAFDRGLVLTRSRILRWT
ncbi:ABC transporter permease [Halostagnicola kamekurae]|uniref:NitT/TauT family transport system permease protein n=1 Tax=Halostagnicola kamekurae TaxID=619731 RepID=A0A1I6TRT6_9EURY|nr:ABC transporter permease [Halostagnicola kamekurae]SFS91973.1 NitT/TauT family transport system permease protein [Halostagnicola kamekurae]